jgi:hypothetical protein
VIARLDEPLPEAKPAELVGADGRTPEPGQNNLAPVMPEASISGPWRRTLVLPDRSGTLRITSVESAREQAAGREEELRYLDENLRHSA